MKTFKPTIKQSKALTMADLADCVASGYVYAVQGTIDLANAFAFANKMHERYEIDIDPSKRSRRRAKGIAQVHLFFYPVRDTAKLHYWMLRTDGTLPEDDTETWVDVRHSNSRLTWENEYELVRLPVAKKLRQKYAEHGRKSNEMPWTWRFTKHNHHVMRSRVKQAVLEYAKNGRSKLLRQVVWSLNHAPGFRGVREQIFWLGTYMQQVWKKGQMAKGSSKRAGKKNKVLPLPDRFALKPKTLQKRKCKEYSVAFCQHRYETGEKTWFPARNRNTLRVELILFFTAARAWERDEEDDD